MNRGNLIRLSSNTSSTITNAAGAQWTVDYATDAYCMNLGFSNVTLDFINEGTLTKRGSAKADLGGSTGTFNVTHNGTLEVDEGTLVFGGTSVVLGASGTVRLTADGTTVPLERTGSLAIGGTLEVLLVDGYTPPNGTTVRLIDYDSRGGSFVTITPPQGRTITEDYASDGLDVTLN